MGARRVRQLRLRSAPILGAGKCLQAAGERFVFDGDVVVHSGLR
jgi:hypothetical protein